MTKFFTLLAVVLLLASPSALAEENQSTGTVSEEKTMDFDTDTYDEDGCFC